jgi:type II secretion system protein G
MKKRNSKGFTLIELLIVVAIIGIIVAIAIPNLLNAIQRAKQKRTMADMRTAGTGAEAYAVDFNHYPAAAASITLPSGITALPTTTFGGIAVASTLNGLTAPTYVRVLPLVDGWSSYYVYGVGTSNQQHYVIGSAGKNGAFEGFVGGETQTFNSDIIFADGQFLQYPAGAQN